MQINTDSSFNIYYFLSSKNAPETPYSTIVLMTVVTVFYRVVAVATLAGSFPQSFLLLKHLFPILGNLEKIIS